MKLIKSTFLFSTSLLLIACGTDETETGETNVETEKDLVVEREENLTEFEQMTYKELHEAGVFLRDPNEDPGIEGTPTSNLDEWPKHHYESLKSHITDIAESSSIETILDDLEEVFHPQGGFVYVSESTELVEEDNLFDYLNSTIKFPYEENMYSGEYNAIIPILREEEFEGEITEVNKEAFQERVRENSDTLGGYELGLIFEDDWNNIGTLSPYDKVVGIDLRIAINGGESFSDNLVHTYLFDEPMAIEQYESWDEENGYGFKESERFNTMHGEG